MSTDEAIAEARDMVARNFICEPCVVKKLLAALERELAKERQVSADHVSLYKERVALANKYLDALAAEKGKVRVLRDALDEAQSCGGLTGAIFTQARAALAATEDAP